MSKRDYPSASKFSTLIEDLVMDGDMTYLDALAHVMKEYSMDEDSMAKVIKKNPIIKAKLEAESRKLNLIKGRKERKLPI